MAAGKGAAGEDTHRPVGLRPGDRGRAEWLDGDTGWGPQLVQDLGCGLGQLHHARWGLLPEPGRSASLPGAAQGLVCRLVLSVLVQAPVPSLSPCLGSHPPRPPWSQWPPRMGEQRGQDQAVKSASLSLGFSIWSGAEGCCVGLGPALVLG